jgi:hypothetical protein
VARAWHVVTAVVAAFALVAQLALVISGASVLVEDEPPALAVRLVRFVSYFTVQANTLVLLVAVGLVRRPDHDGAAWRVLRLAALTGITVTGIVHWFLLRPLLHLTGWSYAADRLLHLAVPLLAVVGWLLFGPRPRVDTRVIGLNLIWPLAWLAATMITGAAVAWYPYPFLDVGTVGVGAVAAAAFGVTALFLVLSGLYRLGDRRLPR